MQLEFFPRTELRLLTDFQKLEKDSLSRDEKVRLIRNPDFFKSPKANDLIRKQHSRCIDKILDLRLAFVEEMLVAEAHGFDPEGSFETWGPHLHEGVQTWIGLDLETLQTPYSELYRILQLLKIKPYQHIIDLGAAYGRLGIIIGGLYIKNSFQGYEYVKARVAEGNRVYQELDLQRCELVTQNLCSSDFKLPDADIYFLYDFGQLEHIDNALMQIKRIAASRPVKVVVRGKYTKLLISQKHAWLELRYQGKLEEFFSIYSAHI